MYWGQEPTSLLTTIRGEPLRPLPMSCFGPGTPAIHCARTSYGKPAPREIVKCADAVKCAPSRRATRIMEAISARHIDPVLSRPVVYPVNQNNVITVLMNVEIPLALFADVLPNALLDPEKFQRVMLKLLQPQCTVLIFATGLMLIIGIKTLSAAMLAFSHIVDTLIILGIAMVSPIVPHICNRVWQSNVKFRVFPSLIKKDYMPFPLFHIEYDPDVFPGLSLVIPPEMMRVLDKRETHPITLKIFDTGEFVILGGTELRQAFFAYYIARQILQKYRDTSSVSEDDRARVRSENYHKHLPIVAGVLAVARPSKRRRKVPEAH